MAEDFVTDRMSSIKSGNCTINTLSYTCRLLCQIGDG